MPYTPPIHDAEALQALRQRGALSNLFFEVGSNMAGLDMNPYLQQSLESRIRDRSQRLDRYEQMARDELIRRRDLEQRQAEMRQAATMGAVAPMIEAGDVGGANQALGPYTDARLTEQTPSGGPYYPDYETKQYAQLQQALIQQAHVNALNRRDYPTAEGIQDFSGLGGRLPTPSQFPTDYEGALETRNTRGVQAQLLMMLMEDERQNGAYNAAMGKPSHMPLIQALLQQLGIDIPVEAFMGIMSPALGNEGGGGPPNEMLPPNEVLNRRSLSRHGRAPVP